MSDVTPLTERCCSYVTTLKVLFDLRLTLDAIRQEEHAEMLGMLPELLRAAGEEHPYDLETDRQEKLLKQLGCTLGPTGGAVDVVEADYLYRLTALGAVMASTKWEGALDETHSQLTEAYKDAKDWLPLRDFTGGFVKNERDFSWWTTYESILHEPFRSGHRLGLVDNWIAVRALVLRCPIANVVSESLAFIPSAIDAVCSPVFAATKSKPAPHSGVTIDLRGVGPVVPGEPEYALRPVAVEFIDFIPVLIPTEHRTAPRVPKDVETWERLRPFYERLSNE